MMPCAAISLIATHCHSCHIFAARNSRALLTGDVVQVVLQEKSCLVGRGGGNGAVEGQLVLTTGVASPRGGRAASTLAADPGCDN